MAISFADSPKSFLVHLLQLAHDFAVGLRLPAGVFASVLHFESGQPAHRCNHAGGSQHAALDRTPLTGNNLHYVSLGTDDRQVRGGLDQAGNIGAHGQNAMMQAGEQRHRLFRVIRIQHLSRPFGFLDRDLQSGIESSQVRLVSSFGCGDQRFQFTLARGVQQHHRRSFARNRVLRASAVDLGDFDRKAIQQTPEGPRP